MNRLAFHFAAGALCCILFAGGEIAPAGAEGGIAKQPKPANPPKAANPPMGAKQPGIVDPTQAEKDLRVSGMTRDEMKKRMQDLLRGGLTPEEFEEFFELFDNWMGKPVAENVREFVDFGKKAAKPSPPAASTVPGEPGTGGVGLPRKGSSLPVQPTRPKP